MKQDESSSPTSSPSKAVGSGANAARALKKDTDLAPGKTVELHSLKSAAHLNGQKGKLLSHDKASGRWQVHLVQGEVKALRGENLQCVVSDADSSPAASPFVSPDNAACPTAGSGTASSELKSNLFPGACVKLQGLKASPHLNGLRGQLLSLDEIAGRWRVKLHEEGVKALKADCLVYDKEYTEAEFQAQAEEAFGFKEDGQGKEEENPSRKSASTKKEEENPNRKSASKDSVEDKLREAQKALEEARTVVEETKLAPGATVEVHSLKSAAHLNGQKGKLLLHDEASGRWQVHLEHGEVKALRSENLLCVFQIDLRKTGEARRKTVNTHADGLPVASSCVNPGSAATPDTGSAATSSQSKSYLYQGAWVKLRGLKAAPHLNGLQGQLLSFDETSERWQVKLDGEGVKALKANCLVLDKENDEDQDETDEYFNLS